MSRKIWSLPVLCLTAFLTTRPAAAATVLSCSAPSGAIACTGTAGTPEDVLLVPFTLAAGATVTIQTYGFGGGVNAAGETVASGGFDSLVALFSGMPTAATILTDGLSDPLASADNLSLYSPGCPPAGPVTVGTVAGVCGDNTLTATLTAGTYTLLLSDAAFVPIAVNPGSSSPFDLTDNPAGQHLVVTGMDVDLAGGPAYIQLYLPWNGGAWAISNALLSTQGFQQIHYNSGIVFGSGSQVYVQNGGNSGTADVVIHGYMTAN